MKKKVLFWAAGLLLLLIVISLVLLPGIVRRYAIKHSKELVGRQIELKNLRINYFTSRILATGFTLFEANDKDAFISFDTLIIKLKPIRLFRDEFVMDRFYLSGLKAKVVQSDSTFNFDDLIAFYSAESDTIPSDTATSEPFKFHFSNIEFKNFNFDYENKTLQDTLTLNDISFFIPYIGWNQTEKSEAGLRFSLKDEGYFESSINVDPAGGDFDARITISGLHLNPFRDYAAQFANITGLQGVVNSQIDITGNIYEAEKSIISGKVEMLDFTMADTYNNGYDIK